MVKKLSAMQETRDRSLNLEDLLEEKMATHSNILTWRIPWKEEPVGLESMGSQRVRPDLATEQQEIQSRTPILFNSLKAEGDEGDAEEKHETSSLIHKV